LTIDDLKTDTYQANARNKLLAEAFYLTGDIEKYSSGFRRFTIRTDVLLQNKAQIVVHIR
jgi:predicted HTH transcriptional regulator